MNPGQLFILVYSSLVMAAAATFWGWIACSWIRFEWKRMPWVQA